MKQTMTWKLQIQLAVKLVTDQNDLEKENIQVKNLLNHNQGEKS